MAVQGIGVDVVDVERFLPFKKDRGNRFLVDNFSVKELEYCFSFSDPAPHLAGTFAAKEAVFKALRKSDLFQSSIEVRREPTGRPVVWIKNRRQRSIFVSISHTATVALAMAIKQ